MDQIKHRTRRICTTGGRCIKGMVATTAPNTPISTPCDTCDAPNHSPEPPLHARSKGFLHASRCLRCCTTCAAHVRPHAIQWIPTAAPLSGACSVRRRPQVNLYSVRVLLGPQRKYAEVIERIPEGLERTQEGVEAAVSDDCLQSCLLQWNVFDQLTRYILSFFCLLWLESYTEKKKGRRGWLILVKKYQTV